MKRIIGLIIFFISLGMLLMLLIHNRLVGLIVMAVLMVAGYYCFSDSC